MTVKTAELPPLSYRPEVDGLRAIAVLMVLLFHCGFGHFAGGYTGVDVFFVISGYLITSLILTDLSQGTFSFSRFYARRIRRLLPPLLATVLLTLAAAVFVMAPEHLADTAKSGALAVVSLSNFYFARVANYFDVSAHSKPFLHMWSLSLEEQFYLFWPTAVFILYRWRRAWGVSTAIAIGIPVGLAVSQYWIARNPNHAYFLLPFRGFQFLLGAACIGLLTVRIQSRFLSQTIVLSGLLMIALSAALYSEATQFPGVAAMLPSIGAMLVIWQGNQAPIQRLLGSRLMVWFGRISYSTYLAHWPVIVFWLYLSITPPSTAAKCLLLMLSVVGGQLLHSLVAERFRYASGERRKPWMFSATLVSVIGLIGITCWGLIATRGLPWRFVLVPEVSEYRKESLFPFLRDYGDGVVHIGSGGSRRVLIFGDSMVQNYTPAILQLDDIRNSEIDIVSRGGCVLAVKAVLINYGSPDTGCLKLRDHLYGIQGTYDLVIWSQNWLGYGDTLHWEATARDPSRAFSGSPDFSGWQDGIDRTLAYFEAKSKKIVVIGPAVTVNNVNPIIQRIGPLTNISGIAAQLSLMRVASADNRESIEKGIRGLVTSKPNTIYIDPRSIICSDRVCHLSDDKFSYFLDSLHNTAAATPMLRNGLARIGLRLKVD